ncbi:MAG: CCA tRNA nucleotidyltransferase [Clostridia bacterium]|nr:CCA tRNA nucleotidyltransferase [Clostridia bacterium]
MKISLPSKVNTIIQTLQNSGFEAYAVGGCVRDSFLHKIPNDWDIATSAKPMEIKELFRRTVDTGIQHGTVTILLGDDAFEVTTYRIDGLYEDSRHPQNVLFTSNLEEDLRRRDFTINAMAYNDEKGLIDIFDGLGDLERGIIRAVGDPKERFSEDALRIMRAVRFAAQLGYQIEAHTLSAITQLADTLQKISAERIQMELIKLIQSEHPDFLRIAYVNGITNVILPEFDAMMKTEQNNIHHMYTVGEHTLKAMGSIRDDKVLRLTMLLHDIGKPQCKTIDESGTFHFYRHQEMSASMAKDILRRLKFDNDTIHKVVRLVQFHDYQIAENKKAVRKAVVKIGEEVFPLLFEIKRADYLAQSEYMRHEKMAYVDHIEEIYQEVLADHDCLSLKDLQISGKDLIELGMKPGKEIGVVLEALLQEVLENPEKNQREWLLSAVSKRL